MKGCEIDLASMHSTTACTQNRRICNLAAGAKSCDRIQEILLWAIRFQRVCLGGSFDCLLIIFSRFAVAGPSATEDTALLILPAVAGRSWLVKRSKFISTSCHGCRR